MRIEEAYRRELDLEFIVKISPGSNRFLVSCPNVSRIDSLLSKRQVTINSMGPPSKARILQ